MANHLILADDATTLRGILRRLIVILLIPWLHSNSNPLRRRNLISVAMLVNLKISICQNIPLWWRHWLINWQAVDII